jgi:hypothetical protein
MTVTTPTATTTPATPATAAPVAEQQASDRPVGRKRSATRDSSPLGVARTAFTLLSSGPSPLAINGRAYSGLPDRDLPLLELRTRLLARSCPKSTRDAVWVELVRRSRTQGAAWTVACVGVALPALTRLATDLCSAFAGDKADVQAEILQGFLSGLATIDLDRPSVINRLRWHAYRGGYAAVREALDAPTPYGPGFDSTPPPPTAGHPDFVLARAVAAGAITQADAEVIGTTRLEDVPLRGWAAQHGLSYVAARQVRSRAERRLLSWLAQQQPGIGAVDVEPGHFDTETSAATLARPRRDQPDRSLPRGWLSHIGPERGVGGCRRTPHTTRRPTHCPEEPRCA